MVEKSYGEFPGTFLLPVVYKYIKRERGETREERRGERERKRERVREERRERFLKHGFFYIIEKKFILLHKNNLCN